MFYLTKQERTLLFSLALIVFLGVCVKYALRQYPQISDLINFVESDLAYQKINVNVASADELEAIPYIGKMTAENIVRFREEKGSFNSVEDLKSVRGIRDKNYAIFSKYIKVK